MSGLELTLGIEEEFFLVDPETRDIIAEPHPGIMEQCERESGTHTVVPELLRSQVETNTRVCNSVAELGVALAETRKLVVDAAEAHGARAMAASTHPFAAWRAQSITPKERYRRHEMRMQEAVRRFLVAGMHIHVGFGDPDSRMRVMTAARRYLPLFVALSSSSPFNSGSETGFKSYRPNIIGALPRTGLPRPFASRAEYDRLVEDYRRLETIQDGSELWWDIRPSHSYPTIELRTCDICPRAEDSMALAALYASLVRWLLRRDEAGDLPPEPPTEIIAENRWLARRYGVLAFIGSLSGEGRQDIADTIAELVELVSEDARALGCAGELEQIPLIVRDGASADRQLDLYRLRRLEGDDHRQALCAVVDQVLEETRAWADLPAAAD